MAQGSYQKVKEVYGNLDPRIRLLVQITGLVVGIYVVLKVIKKSKQVTQDKPFTSEAQATARDLEALNKNPYTRQKISDSQAKAYANKIYTCMNGNGTYENELIGVFYHLFNTADFLAVEKAYGIRTLYSSWSAFRGNMTSAIVSEMSIEEIKKINSILAKKGIKRSV
jgi:hypothetical protein